ncbi:MAG: cytochrome c-type biogenesis protein CcmH [Gammaproteobacteria bacterium]|nr:cytochrome c-type biogenesis protein CcmH [Gammaproteobacteria bacterium]
MLSCFSHFKLSISKIFLALFILSLPAISYAKVEAYSFDNPEQENTYKQLIAELRCLVCQNQNLADSNAELAQDMRRKTYDMVKQGKAADEIVDFMVARYGDFVMYRPPVKSTTLLLWFGPVVLFFIALSIVIVIYRKQKLKADIEISAQQKQRVHSLLDDES